MMSNPRTTFEFQVLCAKNWTVRDLFDDESTAKRAADQVLASGRVEGVRILRIWHRADGEHSEKQVYEKLGQPKPLRDVRIVPIDSAPFCRDEADFLTSDSLAAMGRLFRKYLDEVHLTPLEVLCLDREYKRIWDTESIVMAGVDRVALIQTRGTDLTAKDRRDEIYRGIEAIGVRARRCARRRGLPKAVASTFGAVLAETSVYAEDDLDGRFAASVVLARDLAGHRDWLGKLNRLGALISCEEDAIALSVLDSVVAQVFGNREVLQDALGPQPNLAAALTCMVDVLENASGAAFDKALPHGALFAKGVNDGRLPLFRAVLLERLVRALAGPGELSRNMPSREWMCFRTLANRLVVDDRVIGGVAVAEALLERAALFVVAGGVTGRIAALQQLLGVLDTPARRVCLLRVLDDGLKREPKVRVAAFEAIRSLILSAETLAVFAPSSVEPITPMRAAADLSRWLASAYPPKPVAPLVARLDDLSADYLIREHIIERMDRPEMPLADRAIMLLNFVLSGTLTEGKATALARDRIREHLKRPDFVEAFAAECADEEKQERRLREFHVLLARAGFSKA
ncbi:MAG: hypothetical protein JXQ84_05135 [Rhodospirillaceae bacterium]|nr:hypothetical protein [Rhodospirillaceae bacterium]